jgi:hypothetical protein
MPRERTQHFLIDIDFGRHMLGALSTQIAAVRSTASSRAISFNNGFYRGALNKAIAIIWDPKPISVVILKLIIDSPA